MNLSALGPFPSCRCRNTPAYGVRWQSAAATPLWDTAEPGGATSETTRIPRRSAPTQSGVAAALCHRTPNTTLRDPFSTGWASWPVLLVLTVLFVFCQSAFCQDATAECDGQTLAVELRNAVPEENSEIRGVFQIRSSRQKITNNVPVVCKVVVGGKSWETIYEIAPTRREGAEKLIIRHFPDQPNDYFYARAATPTASLPEPQKVTPDQSSIPLAGSDFWLMDLGLEFLHWPQQRRMKGETPLRLGRAYDVLESVNPTGKEITRVKSFIDKQTGGILAAEAYDAKGKMVKEFTLSGSSFKKVKGVWQLEKMTMENVQKKSRTILRFDLSKD